MVYVGRTQGTRLTPASFPKDAAELSARQSDPPQGLYSILRFETSSSGLAAPGYDLIKLERTQLTKSKIENRSQGVCFMVDESSEWGTPRPESPTTVRGPNVRNITNS